MRVGAAQAICNISNPQPLAGLCCNERRAEAPTTSRGLFVDHLEVFSTRTLWWANRRLGSISKQVNKPALDGIGHDNREEQGAAALQVTTLEHKKRALSLLVDGVRSRV